MVCLKANSALSFQAPNHRDRTACHRSVHKFVECAEKYLNSWIPSLSLIKSTFPASTPPEGHTLSSIDADWIARYKRKNTLIVTFGNEEEEDDAMDEQDEFAFPDHI